MASSVSMIEPPPAATGAQVSVPQPSHPPQRAAVLLGTGGHNVRANRRLRALAAGLAAEAGAVRVVPAYVEAGTRGARPSLGEAVERLVAEGIREIAIVPFVAEWSYPEHLDVPDLVRELAEAHPQVQLRLARVLAAAPGITAQLAAVLSETWTLPPVASLGPRELAQIVDQAPITTARLEPGELPKLPPQAQHVLLCAGRRCLELGSASAYRYLQALLAERGIDQGAQRVKVTRTNCLGPCAAAPRAGHYPGVTHFARLDTATMPAFVEQELVQGGTLPGHTCRPGT